jgi:hypothetical protein
VIDNLSGFTSEKRSMGSHEARVEFELTEAMICDVPLSDDDDDDDDNDDDGLTAALYVYASGISIVSKTSCQAPELSRTAYIAYARQLLRLRQHAKRRTGALAAVSGCACLTDADRRLCAVHSYLKPCLKIDRTEMTV